MKWLALPLFLAFAPAVSGQDTDLVRLPITAPMEARPVHLGSAMLTMVLTSAVGGVMVGSGYSETGGYIMSGVGATIGFGTLWTAIRPRKDKRPVKTVF